MKTRLFVVVAVATGLAATGCSLIGLGIGAAIDSKKKPATIPGWKVESVEPGRKTTLALKDGRVLSGTYRGLEPAAAGDYASRWAASQRRAAPAVRLPDLGPGAVVTTRSGPRGDGEFVGLDHGALWMRVPGGSIARFGLDDVASLADTRGNTLDGAALIRLSSAGEVPFRSEIVLENGPRRVRVPVEDVTQIQVQGGKGKLTGFLIGALVDAVIVIAAIESLNDPWLDPCAGQTCTSCPFVYSFDGERYVLDTEVFGGAIFEAAQRPDRASLEHLAEVGGAYRLRLANELQEIQYVDGVKLLVIDHPPGTRIVPSLDGRLHSLAAPVAPTRATDLRGSDVRALLAAESGRAWISNPFAYDRDRPGDARDGVIFEFPRPRGSSAATLAFRARSTPWASVLLRGVLGLHGRDQQAWTDRMNADAMARGAFLGALGREGLLNVRVWDGSAWRDVGSLANMAEAVARDQAIRVDLAGIPGDVLRVRVDATAGMWVIHGAAADFGRGSPVRVRELALAAARTSRGEDIRDVLAAVDGRRFVMDPGLDSADLAFDAPPPTPGLDRSFVLEATGYYTILVPAEGEPQQTLYDRLVREPGALGRYGAELMRNTSRTRLAGS